MRGKFAKKSLVLGSPYHHETILHPEHYDCETEDRIEFSYLSVVLTVLSRFGHLISEIMILNYYDLYQIDDSKKVFDLVNAHCYKSLTQLHVLSKNSTAFDEFKRPFERVEHLRLEGSFLTLDNANVSFSEMFPSLRFLSLMAIAPENASVFNQTIPNLEALQINNGNFYRTGSIRKLFENNPHIRDLAIQSVNADLLEYVADGLHQLEYLELIEYEDGNMVGSTLHFEQLKSLKMERSRCSLPSNAVFRDLEAFEIDDSARMCTRWIHLVENQSNLKRLRAVRPLDNHAIERLTNSNMSLIEMMIECEESVEFENVIRMIDNANKLELIYVYIKHDEVRQSTFDVLRKRFKHDWKVVNINHVVILCRL